MSDAGFLLQNKFLVFIIWRIGNSDQIFDNGSEELLAGWMKTWQHISMWNKAACWLNIVNLPFSQKGPE